MASRRIVPNFEELVDDDLPQEFETLLRTFAIVGIKPDLSIIDYFSGETRDEYSITMNRIRDLILEE